MFKNEDVLSMFIMSDKPKRPKEKPVHYAVFVIIGLLMFGLSKVVLMKGTTEHSEAMILFMYLGLVALGIGLIKFLISFYKKGGFSKAEKRVAESLAGKDAIAMGKDSRERARYEQEIERRKRPLAKTPSVIVCPVCKTKNYSTSNYCHMCGQKLK